MRAAIYRKGDIVVGDVADPRPIEGQVLVKTLCCGICGSDLHAAKHMQQFCDLAQRTGGRWALDPQRDVGEQRCQNDQCQCRHDDVEQPLEKH